MLKFARIKLIDIFFLIYKKYLAWILTDNY